MSVPPPTRDWLTEHNLVDPSVDLDRVRLNVGGPPTWYLRLVRKRAITLGHGVWFREPEHVEDRALVAHELVHVGQYEELGVPRFFATYLWHLARAGFRYSRTLPLEAPAYARQEEAEQIPH
jgi:hypothetical protein